MRKLFNHFLVVWRHAKGITEFFILWKKTDKEIEQLFCNHQFTKCTFVKGGFIEKTCGKCGYVLRIKNVRKKS